MKPSTLSVLSDDECGRLIEAALEIVEKTGVLVTQPDVVDTLTGAGGSKGEDGRIRLTQANLRDLLSTAPGRFAMHDRAGGIIEIGSGRCWTMCGGTVAKVMAWPDWNLRQATREDAARFARLCDALPQSHCVVPVVEAQDVEPSHAEAISFAETLAHTTKFALACPVRHQSARAWVEMVRIATDKSDLSEHPTAGLLATLLPNLHLDDDCAATSVLAAREGMPLVCMAGSIAGSSGPNTVASTVALKLAGELFQVALTQVVNPGAPVLVDAGAVVLDMNSADIAEAGPEYPLGTAALAQAARTLNLPTYSCALHCDSKVGDFQAGMEKMAGMMGALLAGVDMTTNMGMLSRCSAASYEQMVVDDELCAFLQRFAGGLTVDSDTLAKDVIEEVGPAGNYLGHPHTLRHCRSGEMWYAALLDRSSVGAEAVDLYARAHARAEALLEGHDAGVGQKTRDALMQCAMGA